MSKVPEFEMYPFRVEPLPEDEGGGFVIRFPDLPGCMSDGATQAEAIANGRDAFQAWMEAQVEDGRPVPEPGGAGEPAKFVQRLPKYLHAQLVERAAREGVSMNSLVTAFVAEGLAGRKGDRRVESGAAGVDSVGVEPSSPFTTETVQAGAAAANQLVARHLKVPVASRATEDSFSEAGSAENVVCLQKRRAAMVSGQ